MAKWLHLISVVLVSKRIVISFESTIVSADTLKNNAQGLSEIKLLVKSEVIRLLGLTSV